MVDCLCVYARVKVIRQRAAENHRVQDLYIMCLRACAVCRVVVLASAWSIYSGVWRETRAARKRARA